MGSGKTAAQLESALHIPGYQLERLLHPLTNIGYFSFDGVMWHNNLASSLLDEAHPNSMAPLVLHVVEDGWEAWGHLATAIADPEFDAFKATHGGTDPWAYFEKVNQTQGKQFARAMSSLDALGGYAQAVDYPWNQYSRVVDIAGSLGSVLANILRHNTHPTGVLFDLPEACAQAKAVWARPTYADIADRATITCGSFFEPETLPAAQDGDVWFM